MIVSDAESVTWKAQDNAQGCGGITTATGTFRTNGVGGTVYYGWVRKDSTGTHVIAEPAITIAAGDTGAHAVVTDRWAPASGGTEQLVFISPSAPAIAPQAWSC